MKISEDDLKVIRRIIDKLEDEESKKIYIYRLLYSLTDDIRYIYDMMGGAARKYQREIIKKSEEAQAMFRLYELCDLYSFLLKKLPKSDGNIIIFGAGDIGKEILYWMRRIGFEPKAFCDNSSEMSGTFIEGCPVISVDMLEKKYARSVVIIATYKYHTEIKQQLSGLNISQQLIYEYERNCLLSYWGTPYFEDEIFKPKKNEVFIDAGAFCGETAEEFAAWCPSYKKIYSLEPDKFNFEKLSDNILKKKIRDIELIDAGLWSENKTLYITRGGDDGTGSHVKDTGIDEVKVVSLDNILGGNEATYIKMDIEGSEKEALKGAQNTIKKYKPRLAICLYHRSEDIITLPQYILELVPEYKFKIRHYTTFTYDTILYAYVVENENRKGSPKL